MTNLLPPASRHHNIPAHFTTSSHGVLTFVEALTLEAKRFLTDLGFPVRAAVTYRDLRELRFAARSAGLVIG